MIEKRFTYDDGVWDNNVEDVADALLSEKECCDLLNTLHEENQELKRKFKSMAKELCNCEEDYIYEEW